MNQNDYVILFDETGTPYIAHAGLLSGARNAMSTVASAAANAAKGVGRGVRQNHKYILKVIENNKPRYFYTQEEVKAYYAEKKKAVSDAASEAAKKTREATDKAKTAASNAVKNAQSQYDRMRNEFREGTGQAARDRRDEAEKKAETARRDEKRAEDRWWTSAKEAMARPTDKSEQRERDNMESMSEKTHQRNLAEDEARRARIEYSKTPLAKAEKKAEEIKGNIKDILGYDERSRRDSAQARVDEQRANGQTPTTTENTNAARAQREYNRTPLGMIENARNTGKKAKEALGNMVDTAQDMISRARASKEEPADETAKPHGREKKVGEGSVTAEKNKKVETNGPVGGNSASVPKGAKTETHEYSDNDPDFDDKNYSNENNVADTDFYTFKRPDGRIVILQEDMKWVLPAGVSANDPGIQKAMKQFSDRESSAQAIGDPNYTAAQYTEAFTEAITEAAEKAKRK